MSSHRPPLGRCPECEEPIPRSGLLIEYDSGGRRAMYAECPACASVVHPSRGRDADGSRSGG